MDRRKFMGLIFVGAVPTTTSPPNPLPAASPGTRPAATSAALQSVDEYGIVHGRISPPGAQIILYVDDNIQSNYTIATSDASANFQARLLVTGGRHHFFGRTIPGNQPIIDNGVYVIDRSNKQQSKPPKPKAAPGLAAKYVKDKGLKSDPNVLFYVDFADPNWPTHYFNSGNVVSLPERPVDVEPNSGLPRVNMQYTPDGRFSPCFLSHDFKKAGQPQPDELYYRYYFRPKTGYQCNVQGKKLPGLAGRYGTCGNGGNYTTGRKESDGSLCGWSARNLAYAAPAPGWLIPLETYLYYADMGTGFGVDWLWDAPWMEEEKDYCIEQYVKMNTIDMSNPDSLGNGVGNFDGILRVWLNDILVFERTNLRYRHHPLIHVSEVWMDHYHGGTTPPEALHPFAHWGMVVAKKRIGMINMTAPGVATPISNNTMHQANPCLAERNGTGLCAWSGSVGLRDSFHTWNSGIWNPDARTLIIPAGGEVCPGPAMGFNKDTGMWDTASAISTQVNGTSYLDDPTFDTKWCMFADGVMAIGHTYATPEWVPAAWGITGSKGGFILPVREVVYKVGASYRPVICDSATKVWHKAASEGSEGSVPGFATGGGNSCVIDVANRRYLCVAAATSVITCDHIATLTFADTSGIGVWSRGPNFPTVLMSRYPVMVAVPTQRRVLIAGVNASGVLQLNTFNMDTLASIDPVTWQGDSIYSVAGLGLAWCAWAGCFMALPCTSPTWTGDLAAEEQKPVVELFRIIPDWNGGPWTIKRMPIIGAVGYTPTFTGKRFFADDSDQTVNWVSSYHGPVYRMKVPA